MVQLPFMVFILAPTKIQTYIYIYIFNCIYSNCSGHLSGQVKTFHQPGFRRNKSLKYWWDGQGKRFPLIFVQPKLGNTAQPSSKSSGLSWLSRLRRGLCHCLVSEGSAISSKIFEEGVRVGEIQGLKVYNMLTAKG